MGLVSEMEVYFPEYVRYKWQFLRDKSGNPLSKRKFPDINCCEGGGVTIGLWLKVYDVASLFARAYKMKETRRNRSDVRDFASKTFVI
jgi:hypothetical protein